MLGKSNVGGSGKADANISLTTLPITSMFYPSETFRIGSPAGDLITNSGTITPIVTSDFTVSPAIGSSLTVGTHVATLTYNKVDYRYKYEVKNLYYVGGRIFYDDGDNGAVYTFYDSSFNELTTQTVAGLANAVYYKVEGIPTKDR